MNLYQHDDEYQRESTLEDRYQAYLDCADDGHGKDCMTGRWLLTFDEWLGL